MRGAVSTRPRRGTGCARRWLASQGRKATTKRARLERWQAFLPATRQSLEHLEVLAGARLAEELAEAIRSERTLRWTEHCAAGLYAHRGLACIGGCLFICVVPIAPEPRQSTGDDPQVWQAPTLVVKRDKTRPNPIRRHERPRVPSCFPACEVISEAREGIGPTRLSPSF